MEASKKSKKAIQAGEFPAPEKPMNVYSLEIDDATIQKLMEFCAADPAYEKYDLPYTICAYRNKERAVGIIVYTSKKIIFSGRGTRDFVSNVYEPKITGKALLGYDEVWHPEWFEFHAGLDESGKGDLFGPLVSCCVIAGGDAVKYWRSIGVKDSKLLADSSILKLEKFIRATPGVVVKTVFAPMERYNFLYDNKYNNMNLLLTYFHFVALRESLAEVEAKGLAEPRWGLLDEFCSAPYVQRELELNGIDFDLKMRPRAESDPVVAAASIVARAEFLREYKKLREISGMPLPKGCSADAVKALRQLWRKVGKRRLVEFAKMHFKVTAGAFVKSEKSEDEDGE